MSLVVHKYNLNPWATYIQLPAGAQLLYVNAQGSLPRVWALVDPDAPRVDRAVFAQATGDPLPDGFVDAEYVGTFMVDEGSGPIAFHVFDGGER